MENLEFLQDNTLQHAILVETLLTKLGEQGRDSMSFEISENISIYYMTCYLTLMLLVTNLTNAK